MIRALLLALVFLFIPVNAAAGEMPGEAEYGQVEGLGAKAYCLIERETGRILYGQNIHEMLPMASTTKIMTALIAIENCAMDEMVTTGENAYGVPGTSMYLQRGETLSMKQMLQGLLVRSANDAAVAIAEHISESVDAFAEKMNDVAAQMGIDAHFVTPNGLDAPGHGASALAMARLAAKALEYPQFREFVSTKRVQMPWQGSEYDRVLTNKNKLLANYEGATGVKTGYTSKAGRCLVFSAQRDGMELVGTVLNCYTWFDSAEKLLDAGFENFRMVNALDAGDMDRKLPVSGGVQREIPLKAVGALKAPVGSAEEWTVEYDLPERVSAPVMEGERIGAARLLIGGKTVARCDIAAAQDVPANTFAQAFLRIARLWSAIWAR